MTMFVDYVTSEGKTVTFECHVGEKLLDDRRDHPSIILSGLESIQADGDELAYIIENFVNIPYSKKSRVQKWHAPFDRFILEHLRHW